MELFDYPFMTSALLVGLVLGALFSLIGIFIVTRGMAFFSDFIAHSAILGGALALLLDAEPTTFLMLYSLLIAFAISAVWNRFPLSRDTVLGVFYGGTVAGGIALITAKGIGRQSLIQLLFGDILLIRPADMALSAGLLLIFGAFLALNMKNLIKSTLLPEISMAEGVRVRRYDYALIALTAVTIALSIKLIGVLLANAMVVIPAATAKALSRNLKQFLIIAPVMGIVSFTAGIILSFYLNLPSGPSVILVAFGIFIATLIRR